MNVMKNLLNIIIILCVCLNCWRFTEGTEGRKIDSHTIQLSSLFPSPSSPCVLSPKASKSSSSLHVVNKHGPCSHLSKDKDATPDHDDILKRDQARVDSIHSKLSKKFTDRIRPSQSTDLPATGGNPLGIGAGNYLVTIGIGTPMHNMSLVFDTGSDLSWIQCEPCTGSCYPQKEPIFDPSSSSSYSNINCSSPVCASLDSAGLYRNCSASNCLYGSVYGDFSYTTGFLAKENFTLTSSVFFAGITFGCGETNYGLFKGTAGLLGLGRGELSFPSQTAKTFNNTFSYCLPSLDNYTGHLTFGSAGISDSVKFTPISTVRDASFYGIEIVGITVGDQKLDIPLTVFSTPGTIIDSGSVITHLPPKAYAALKSAFMARMSNYTTTSGALGLDTCYDFTGVDPITTPKVTFSFSGDVNLELEQKGIFYAIKTSQVCLAFAANFNDDDVAVFGNIQQKSLEVVYDGAGGRIGFAPKGCM